MAAQPGQIKPSRYFVALALIIVALYGLVFFTGDKKPHPKLGLDLQGGTSMTLSARTPGGGAPSREQMEQARQIISERVDLSGVSEPSVTIDGTRNIVVQVAGSTDPDELRKLVQPAQLRFRKVLASTADSSGEDPEATASASPSGSASASASASPSASASSAAPSQSASASASGAPSGSPSASSTVDPEIQKLRESVVNKLGDVLSIAQQVQDPSQVTGETAAIFEPFKTLTGDEVAVLPAQMQYNIPQISCAKLNQRPPGSIVQPDQEVVACGEENGAPTKFMLDKASVVGEDVGDASFGTDPTNGWVVSLEFKGEGQNKWTKLTSDVYGDGTTPEEQRRVAIVLDNRVVSAPTIQGVIAGDAQIYGSFTKNDVDTLSRQLKYGSLPLSFKIESVDTVSATLGLAALEAGLLAGALGIGLVVLYCLFYYRALGLVVVASLLVSAAAVFASLVLLGRNFGYTLSLAGVAGFIVAIGITADSFVVFFERLKDEVKDGRTVRSAVPRAWSRARRTILSADTVLMLAAAVLYLLAVGGVKGFAFTLGMSTIIDVMVVFLFTHPLVALLSRANAFTSPRFSGLGNVRSDRSAAASATGRSGALRTKES
ncbi:protein translocase subunit SecD [Virgisporangium aurantiacum]|uniref:Protein translocase subunit SecD n=1 Tax=Virgisporangium aurantiacum TaxID=175570 RepID=A0A8J3Z6A9_9ACTN|nr:protein translocase subunit SecD [Virgisporangium aurantiacum]